MGTHLFGSPCIIQNIRTETRKKSIAYWELKFWKKFMQIWNKKRWLRANFLISNCVNRYCLSFIDMEWYYCCYPCVRLICKCILHYSHVLFNLRYACRGALAISYLVQAMIEQNKTSFCSFAVFFHFIFAIHVSYMIKIFCLLLVVPSNVLN